MINKIICGNCDKKILDKLKSFGLEVLLIKDNLSVDPAIKNHADLSVIKISETEIIIEKTQEELIQKLEFLGYKVSRTASSLDKQYPSDVLLNFLIIGKFIIGNYNYADETLKQKIKEYKLTIINTNQGYARCSSLKVNDNALITDDESIEKAAKLSGIDTLLISKGDIKLNGHDYGFIGGASCNINQKILFFGELEKHKDSEKIKQFLSKHSCEYEYISGLDLTDIGSAICL